MCSESTTALQVTGSSASQRNENQIESRPVQTDKRRNSFQGLSSCSHKQPAPNRYILLEAPRQFSINAALNLEARRGRTKFRVMGLEQVLAGDG